MKYLYLNKDRLDDKMDAAEILKGFTREYNSITKVVYGDFSNTANEEVKGHLEYLRYTLGLSLVHYPARTLNKEASLEDSDSELVISVIASITSGQITEELIVYPVDRLIFERIIPLANSYNVKVTIL